MCALFHNMPRLHRYVDMIMSPSVVDTFKARARMTSAMRRLLDAQGFLEVCCHVPVTCWMAVG